MKLCIIGCGNMGLIYAHYFTRGQIVKRENLLLVEKNQERRQELQQKQTGTIVLQDSDEIREAKVILLCIKPQDFSELASVLRHYINKDALIISIMAGIKISSIQKQLHVNSVVRAMPNAPAFYGKGMTVFCCSENLPGKMREIAEMLLAVTGKVSETNDEHLLNAVTAISGSGPAYFFFLADLMIKKALDLGISKNMAEILVKQTMLGASVMLNESGKNCNDLVGTVASKGGTTEAALLLFQQKGLPEIIAEGLQKAAERAAELSE